MAERVGFSKRPLESPMNRADFSATHAKSTISRRHPLAPGCVRLPEFAAFASAVSLEMTLALSATVGTLTNNHLRRADATLAPRNCLARSGDWSVCAAAR